MIIVNGVATDDVTIVSSNVDSIKLKTDNLPSDPADQSEIDAKLGVTSDFAAHQTTLGYLNSLYQHEHSPGNVYPTLADGVTITGAAGAWALGAKVEIIPQNTITTSFDIHFINFEATSANDVYELVLYKGAAGAEVEIGRIRTYRTSTIAGSNSAIIQIPAQLAHTRISGAVASSGGGSDTVTISVMYHAYT